MKKNYLFILGAAAMLASCSNSEVIEQQAEPVVESSDVAVVLDATTNIKVDQTRAVLDGWSNTPIRVWGLDNDGGNWTNATAKLFTGRGYAEGTVAKGGAVTLDKQYFYPMNNAVNFSFYACAPNPGNPTVQADKVIVPFTIYGNNDILWAEDHAAEKTVGDKTYAGYNARYFRNGGAKPKLTFNHLLTRLNFQAKKGAESNSETILPVKIKNITITASANATMIVAGDGKGTLTEVVGTTKELPVFFGDDTYATRGALNLEDDLSLSEAGTVMVLPRAGAYQVTVELAADGITDPIPVSTFEIEAKDVNGFLAGKAYTINLTVYGLSEVTFDNAILTPWDEVGDIIDTEVN